MNWYLDVFPQDCSDASCEALAAIRRCQEADRSGPCEDDVEVTCPYVGMLPEESHKEEGSPLNFGTYTTSIDDPRFVGAVLSALLSRPLLFR